MKEYILHFRGHPNVELSQPYHQNKILGRALEKANSEHGGRTVKIATRPTFTPETKRRKDETNADLKQRVEEAEKEEAKSRAIVNRYAGLTVPKSVTGSNRSSYVRDVIKDYRHRRMKSTFAAAKKAFLENIGKTKITFNHQYGPVKNELLSFQVRVTLEGPQKAHDAFLETMEEHGIGVNLPPRSKGR